MIKEKKQTDIAALLLTVYSSIVWLIFASEYLESMAIIIFISVMSYLCVGFFLKKIRSFDDVSPKYLDKQKKIIIFASASLIVFLIMMIWFWAALPGSFSVDSINQYTQAYTGRYVDWHPVWHTFVFFTLPLKIFGTASSIVFLQILYFVFVMGYLTLTIAELWNVKAAALSVSYIILNPYTCFIMLYPWKDVAFAIGGLFCTIMSIRLVKFKNTNKLWKLIILGIFLAFTTLFRHNAILYTAPLVIFIAFNTKKDTWLKILSSFVIVLVLIKGPVYSALGVTTPGSRVLEVAGLPLTIIGNVVVETPNKMDDELSDFAYSMATKEERNEYYSCGSFNNIKWCGIADTSVVEKQGYIGMFKLMLKCFKLSPSASLEALFKCTNLVYGFEDGNKGYVKLSIYYNEYGIERSEKASDICNGFINTYYNFINESMFKYFATYGIAIFVMMLLVLGKLKFNSWESWKKAFLIIPILCYDFGTMLLLTTYADSRFFFITFLVTPLIVVYAYSKWYHVSDE